LRPNRTSRAKKDAGYRYALSTPARALRIALIAWAIWWFVGYIPAHERGKIKLDNTSTASAVRCVISSGGCCTPSDPNDTSPKSTDACAVCHLVAQLFTPPITAHTLITLGVLRDLPDAAQAPIHTLQQLPTHTTRGPPA
jgi:hypothetical protein